MGQGYSNTVRDGDGYFDRGQLEEAETQYLIMVAQKEPSNASDEALLTYASCKLQASMNLGVIHMMRGQTSQGEKWLGEAAQLELRHSDSQRQHHVSTLAVFYLAAMSCVTPRLEAEHLLQRIVTTPFVAKALEARMEQGNLVGCAHAFLLFLLDRPLPLVVAPLLRLELAPGRIVYNTPESFAPTINFEVDGELEGVELDETDDIGDVPSDDDDGLVGPESTTHTTKPASTSTNSNGCSTQVVEAEKRQSYFESRAKRPAPFIELLRALVLTRDPHVEPEQAQALAQAARALAIEQQRTVYAGGHPFLYTVWKNRGSALARSERHGPALVAYMIALASNWTCVAAWVDVARAFSNAGRDTQARTFLAYLTNVIAPNQAEGWLERSRICMKSGKYAEAAMCCDRITLDIDPTNLEACERRAFATLQLRRWNSRAIYETLQLTDNALSINPYHAPTLRTKARALIECGRYQEALTALDVLLSLDANDAEAFLAKATVFRHLKQFEEAFRWYKLSLASNPHSADVALHLALCHFQVAISNTYRPSVSTYTTPGTQNPGPASPSTISSPSTPSNSSSTTPSSVNSAESSEAQNGNHHTENTGKPSSTKNSSPASSPALKSSSGALNSSGLSNSMICDPSLMPDGTFVGSLPFNQADSTEYPTMLTVMVHLHSEPRLSEVNHGLEATELALDISTRYPSHDDALHYFYEPSALPRTSTEKYADDSLDLVKLQNQYVKSQIWSTRALLLAFARRPSEALTAIEHAIEESPNYLTVPLIAKGEVLSLSGKPAEDVFAEYRKALEIDPESEIALLSIIHLLLSQGESKEALKYTTRLSKLATDGFLLNPRLAIEIHASTLFHLANYDQAYKYCLEHLPPNQKERQHSPRISAVPVVLQDSQSISNNEEEVEEDPYHVRLLNIAAQSLHQLGKCDEAQSFFDRSLRPDPLNVYTWNEKARCLLQNKRFDDALNYFDRALVMNPEDIRTICNRALCMCLLGNIEEGAEILLKMEKGERHKEASEWLQSLSATERAYHFDSLAAARELQKRRDREAVSAQSEERNEEM